MADTGFGRRLKRRRQAAGYRTQGDLAEAMGVPRSTVGAWESGKQYPERFIGMLENLLGPLDEKQPPSRTDPRLLELASQLTDEEAAELVRLLSPRARDQDRRASGG